MKRKINKSTFWIVAVIIACITYVAVCGLKIGSFSIPSAKDMRFGIDIRGGVEATYFPKDYDGVPTLEELNSAKKVIEQRCDAQNITDREITVNQEKGSILVRFPWKSDETDFDPEAAISELGETALLTFQDPNGNVLVEGKNVKKATAGYDQSTNLPIVQLEFDNDGATAFEEATGNLIGQRMSIYMDDTMISSPTVNSKISGGTAQITGLSSYDEASDLASKINSGALPFSLESNNYSIISPSMGTGALNVMVYAGLLAFAIICLFMLLYYRLPGFVAVLALTLQVAGQLLALSVTQFTLTLPGIAAIILSIGVGVDTNIITAERIKEEIAEGKSVRSAIDAGFNKAFSAVFDGNITNVIVAVILMIFGSGTMISFGYTLLTGVILNFVCSIFCAKLMTKSLGQYKFVQNNSKLFGNGKKKEKVLNLYKNRVKFYVISLAVIVVGVVCIFVNGIKFDIQFKGGALITYSYDGDVDLAKIDSIAEEIMQRDCDVQTKEDFATGKTKLVLSFAETEGLESSLQDELTTRLEAEYPDSNIESYEVSIVEPFTGKDFAVDSIKAILIAAVLIILYVWFSFRKVSGLSAGVTGVIALVHDVIIVFMSFIIFKMAINESFIAAALTILGYSINDTIVIFDRIRENRKLNGSRVPIEEVVNKSVSQSMTRSINTSMTTLLCIVIVYIFACVQDISSIKTFALPMIFGIVSGCYSSICVAGPIWTSWQKRKANKRK